VPFEDQISERHLQFPLLMVTIHTLQLNQFLHEVFCVLGTIRRIQSSQRGTLMTIVMPMSAVLGFGRTNLVCKIATDRSIRSIRLSVRPPCLPTIQSPTMRLSATSIVPVLAAAIVWARSSGRGGIAVADAADRTTATTTTTARSPVSIASALRVGSTGPSLPRDSVRHQRRRHLQETPTFCAAERAALAACTNGTWCGTCVRSALERNYPDFGSTGYTCQTYKDVVCAIFGVCPCLSPCAEPFFSSQQCSVVEMVEYNTNRTFECNITTTSCGSGSDSDSGSGSAAGGGGGGTSGGRMATGGGARRGGVSVVALVVVGWGSLVSSGLAAAAVGYL
jgi:uncharacterized membrane protein YgcG